MFYKPKTSGGKNHCSRARLGGAILDLVQVTKISTGSLREQKKIADRPV